MNKNKEAIKTDLQVGPTESSAVSGTEVLSMKNYTKAVAKLIAHQLPDEKGEGNITLSLYETLSSGLTGSEITSSVAVASLTSASDVILTTEIADSEMSVNSDFENIYAYVVGSTESILGVTVDRAGAEYEPAE